MLPATRRRGGSRARSPSGSCRRCSRCSPPRSTAPSSRREVVETAALRRSDEMKTALLRSVSHDLRTPLTAILSATASLDPEHPDAEQVAEVREVVLEAATRLAALVEKLLDLSRLQSGSAEQHARPRTRSRRCSSRRSSTSSGDRALLRLSLDDDLPLLVGDAGQLERAFANLIENALRYGAGKPVLVRARVVGGRVRVRIIDQGPGIRPGDLERIFLPFYRSPGQPPSHQGSGLGLAIAKGFIEAGGGRHLGRVAARPGHELRRRAAAEPRARRREPAAGLMAGERILVCDDDPRSCARCGWCCAAPATRC